MRICDATQFYSERGGGVRRYLLEKRRYLMEHTEHEHVLVIPGARTEVRREGRCTTVTVASPPINRTSRYRVLLNLAKVEDALLRLRPDVIESGDPYHLGWRLLHVGRELAAPVVGFYHSHFPEAYLRTANRFLGGWARDRLLAAAKRYIPNLYGRCAMTLVPSEHLRDLLAEWGVGNARTLRLGVDLEVFQPRAEAGRRGRLGLREDRCWLLYVGRLAGEKNTHTLMRAFALLEARHPGVFGYWVVGDGVQRTEVERVRALLPEFRWDTYCDDSAELAEFYRAADVFVHPGVCETFGLVALEAQASGCPVAGIRGSYMDANIRAGLDLWAGGNTAEALADAIWRFYGADRQRLGRDAAARVHAEFSWNGVFRRQLELYEEARAGRREAQRV